jgi:hypothetical protein
MRQVGEVKPFAVMYNRISASKVLDLAFFVIVLQKKRRELIAVQFVSKNWKFTGL